MCVHLRHELIRIGQYLISNHQTQLPDCLQRRRGEANVRVERQRGDEGPDEGFDNEAERRGAEEGAHHQRGLFFAAVVGRPLDLRNQSDGVRCGVA